MTPPPDRTCYILGAGFSNGCGMPLARDLTKEVFHYRWRKDPLNVAPAAPLLGPGDFGFDALELERSHARVIFPGSDFATTWPDYEEMMTVLDDAAKFERDVVSPYATGSNLWVDQLRRSQLKGLSHMLAERTRLAPAGGIDRIATFLASRRHGTCSLISFNWDTLIEIAAERAKESISISGTGGGICLIKPHGSLDLVELPVSRWEDVRSSDNVFGLREIGRYPIDGVEHILLRGENPSEVADRTVGVFGDALLVTPNRRKEYRSPWIRDLWRVALRLVRAADEIVVAGFSFPEADTRPRILLTMAAADRKVPLKIRVIDPTNAKMIAERLRGITGVDAEPDSARWENVL